MIQDCKFDESVDIQETRPGLSCDISTAKETGAILDIGVCDEYNGFSDPEQVGTVIRDIFTQMDNFRQLAKQHGVTEFGTPLQVKSSIEQQTSAVKE